MKYYIVTYGCQMNYSDSDRIAMILEAMGYKKAQDINGADLLLINMCSVRQSAVDRIYGLADKYRKAKTKPLIILTGCILKRDKNKLRSAFDIILEDIRKLPEILGKKLKAIKQQSVKLSANVPIMTGCNNFCSYCVVPYTRGQEISRPSKEIICEIKELVKRGCKEIWLLGQNVNSYKDFPRLLKAVNDIPGNFWIRFTSSHPKDFSDELIDALAIGEKITPYLNLPVQAGDDKILKAMNRPYTIKQYKDIVKRVRIKIPNITISTDIIVGFPGETKKQFQNSIKLFKDIKYDMAYISEYSSRFGTKASKMKDNVPKKEKAERKRLLNEVLKETALEKNKAYIGKTVEVLIDKPGWFGKTKEYKTVKVKSNKNLLGQFIKAKVIKATSWNLEAELIK